MFKEIMVDYFPNRQKLSICRSNIFYKFPAKQVQRRLCLGRGKTMKTRDNEKNLKIKEWKKDLLMKGMIIRCNISSAKIT